MQKQGGGDKETKNASEEKEFVTKAALIMEDNDSSLDNVHLTDQNAKTIAVAL